MAQQPYAGTYALRFTPLGAAGDGSIDLSAALVSHSSAWPIRMASHRYLKRDGAQQEPMGADAAKATYRLTFVGPTMAADLRSLLATIRQQPRGLLVDPIFGQLQVACTGISDVTRDLRSSRNAVDVTIGFEEDSLDTTVQVDLLDSPAASAARVTARLRIVSTATDFPVSIAGVVSRVNLFLSAVSSAASGIVDLTLAAKLAASGRAIDVAVAEALANPVSTGARAYSSVSRLVDLYAACIAADRAVARSRPAPQTYTVDGPVSVFALAARLYGAAQAQQKAAEIMAANRISDPLWIPAGTTLTISKPAA